MRHFIIRTHLENDYIARLTYESLKLVESDDIMYHFAIEEGETDYKFLSEPQENYIIRQNLNKNNFGGGSGVRAQLDLITKCNIDDGDEVIISDSDIILYKDPFDIFSGKGIDHGGLGAPSPWSKIPNGETVPDVGSEIKAISGQLVYYSSEYFNFWKSSPSLIEELIWELDKIHDVADDTLNSYLSDKFKFNKMMIPSSCGLWSHKKVHDEFYPRTDWKNIVKEICKKYDDQ